MSEVTRPSSNGSFKSLQSTNSLQSSNHTKIDLLVMKEQMKGISPFDFGTCRSGEQ